VKESAIMARLQHRRVQQCYLVVALASVLAALVQPAYAADTDPQAASLQWIPADAAFYGALLHGRAQWEAVTHSRAWAKLKSLPAVQTARQKLEQELKDGGSLAQVRQVYQQPENQQLIAMLGDMVSQEVFFYGGPSWVGFIDLAGQLNAAQSYGPLLMLLTGQSAEKRADQMQAAMLLRTLANNLSLIRIPDLIIGFKLSETKRAQDQLKRLETVLMGLQAQISLLQGRAKKEKLPGGEFLTLTLDGGMVPWQQFPFKKFERKEGEFDALVKELAQLRLTLALGIRNNYLLLSIGASTNILKTLGADTLLSDRPELKPLAARAEKRITSIAYVSRALQAESQTSQLDGLIKLAREILPQGDLSAEQREKIRKDLSDLAGSMKTGSARAGATLSFSFRSRRGVEGYGYDYGEHSSVDGSKPLTLLNHVGGSPLFAMVGRSQSLPESYQKLAKALQIGYRYFRELGLPKLDQDARERFEQIAKAVGPLIERLDRVTSTMLLPALADGQVGLVVDAKLTSRQWIARLPATDRSLPLIEPAGIFGVSDSARLRKSLAEYRSMFNELSTKLHEAVPSIPDYQIPEPESRKVKTGMLFFFALPADWGINERIAPTLGLSAKVAAATLSRDHAERLLAATPLKIEGGPLGDLGKPRAMATYFHWAGVVQALTPWVEQGLRAAGLDPSEKVEVGDESWKGVLKQVPRVLEVLQVFRSYSSSTYFEGPVLVTHSETVIEDL
jgi:hypothetical protein